MSSILLIYPKQNGIFIRMPYPVLCLAGYLRQNGICADICDLQLEKKEEIDFKQYDYFGFSLQFTGPQIKSGLETARYLRAKGVAAPFIWGGIHSTITAQQTAENEFVDYVVRGEGEETLYQLIHALDRGSNPESVAGLSFRKEDKIINTPDAEFIDLENIPPLPYDLLRNLSDYSELKRKPSIVSIGTSRGCPFNCGFCYAQAVHRNRWRAMSASRAILEVKNILKYFRPDIITANDDYFFADIQRIREIALKIIEEKIDVKWSGGMRFDSAVRLPDDFWSLLERAGFINPNFGGESGSTEVLNLINKKITVEQMEETVCRLKKYNFIMYANYMFGLPGEKYSDIMKTFDLIKKLSHKNNNFFTGISVYTPYPGTPLYPTALEYGFKAPKRLVDWAGYQYNSVFNLPWLKGRTRSIVRTTTLFTHFSFNQRMKIKYNLPSKNILFVIAYFVLSVSARLRWVFNFYAFPVEWRIYEYICRLFNISER